MPVGVAIVRPMFLKLEDALVGTDDFAATDGLHHFFPQGITDFRPRPTSKPFGSISDPL